MKDFLFGFLYPFKCIKYFFSTPKIIFISIIPVIINLFIYGIIFFFTYKWLFEYSSKITGVNSIEPSFWQEIMNIVLLIIFFIILLFICYLAFTTIGGIITAPFNEEITCIIEKNLTGQITIAEIGFLEDIWLNIKAEIIKILFYLAVILILFLISLIPLFGVVISTVFGLLFSFLFNTLDFIDYPMTRRMYSLRYKLKVVTSKLMLSYGFGCIAFIFMLVPLINIFFKPLFVVSGTSLYFEKNYSKF